ncbi:cell division protein, partial [Tribonema minus]
MLLWLGIRGRGASAREAAAAKPWAGLFRAPAQEEKVKTGKRIRLLLSKRRTWLGIVVLLLLAKALVWGPASKMVPPAELPMSEFLRLTATKAKEPALTSLKVTSRGKMLYEVAGRPHFTRQVPLADPLLEHLLRHGVKFGAAEAEPVGRGLILAQLFPLAWLAMMYSVLRRNLGETVGSAGRQVQGDTLDRSLTFDDVAGIDEAKAEVRELVAILRDPAPYVAAGARLPSGVMLVGPPGTGKTLLARVMAAEAGVPYYYCSGSDFVEMFVGRGAARVRKLFARAAKTAPCIVFFDELDALGKQRSMGANRGSNDEAEQTLNQLLACMDGLDTNNNGVIVVAATNRFDMLDDALTRPGRFDRIVRVGVPEEAGRQASCTVHTRNMQLEDPALLVTVAAITPGLTGAELASVANEAAIRAARRSCVQVSLDDFQGAVKAYYTSRSKIPTNLQNLMKGLL